MKRTLKSGARLARPAKPLLNSAIRLLTWRGDRLRDTTDNRQPDKLATDAETRPDAIDHAPGQDIPAVNDGLEHEPARGRAEQARAVR